MWARSGDNGGILGLGGGFGLGAGWSLGREFDFQRCDSAIESAQFQSEQVAGGGAVVIASLEGFDDCPSLDAFEIQIGRNVFAEAAGAEGDG